MRYDDCRLGWSGSCSYFFVYIGSENDCYGYGISISRLRREELVIFAFGLIGKYCL